MGSQILPGVPASVTRKQVIEMAESLGLDVRDLMGLKFHRDGIDAEVRAHEPTREREPGQPSSPWTADGETVATHRICIRITDEPATEGATP